MFHNVEPKFHRTLVHLVQRFTVPFASHTRAEDIRCTLKRKMWQMTVIRCHGRSFHASPHRRAEEGIQGLWDLAITSAST